MRSCFAMSPLVCGELDCTLETGTDEGLTEQQHYVLRFAEEVTRNEAIIAIAVL